MIILKTLIFLIVVPGSVTILLPYFLLTLKFKLFVLDIGIFHLLGLIPIFLGVVITFYCFWDFIFAGKGTPAPMDPPKKLVVKGLYRVVRNPMYSGIVLILIGEILLFQSLILCIYTLLVLSVFHLFVVFYEEPILENRFRDSYINYFNSVPRWIPNINSFRNFQKRKWFIRTTNSIQRAFFSARGGFKSHWFRMLYI